MVFDRGKLIQEIKKALLPVYGDQFQGLVLYGSEARGTATSDSDIDFIVLLKGPVKLGTDLRKIINALYSLQLEVIRPLHGLPVEKGEFEKGEYALYRYAKEEGIFA